MADWLKVESIMTRSCWARPVVLVLLVLLGPPCGAGPAGPAPWCWSCWSCWARPVVLVLLVLLGPPRGAGPAGALWSCRCSLVLTIRGTLKSWTKLWCVLKPGVLLIYKTHKNGQWVGTVLLNACELIERPSKKDGFCFKLFHPLEQSIWAVKSGGCTHRAQRGGVSSARVMTTWRRRRTTERRRHSAQLPGADTLTLMCSSRVLKEKPWAPSLSHYPAATSSFAPPLSLTVRGGLRSHGSSLSERQHKHPKMNRNIWTQYQRQRNVTMSI
ncbi:Oxysterol-binding protein-related protein 8 [Liparis tanakae]|uniref:Oxysterol-binding protein-related protein 8 n=1 Tax=Liparis tanakae TaxID=230148 RepID=A0A4Z2EJI5_9TELE|nr:Oxysterol-binding protein-related protein 8 [Liparis tanakae]